MKFSNQITKTYQKCQLLLKIITSHNMVDYLNIDLINNTYLLYKYT